MVSLRRLYAHIFIIQKQSSRTDSRKMRELLSNNRSLAHRCQSFLYYGFLCIVIISHFLPVVNYFLETGAACCSRLFSLPLSFITLTPLRYLTIPRDFLKKVDKSFQLKPLWKPKNIKTSPTPVFLTGVGDARGRGRLFSKSLPLPLAYSKIQSILIA